MQCTAQSTAQKNKSVLSPVNVNNSNEIQNSENLIDMKTTAQLTGWHRNTVLNKISSGKIISHKMQKPTGGFKTLVVVSSLPEKIQQKYKRQVALNNPDSEISSLTETQIRYSIAMEKIIIEWNLRHSQAKKRGLRKRDIDLQFMNALETGMILRHETEIVKKYSIKTLYKQRKKWEASGRKTSSLAPDSKSNRGRKQIEAKVFYSMSRTWLLEQPKTRASHLYDQLSRAFIAKDSEVKLPSYRTFLNFYNKFYEQQGILIAAGQGKKSLDNLMPFVSRDNDALPGDIWQYDGYVMKIKVKNPYKEGHLMKPIVVYFLDVCTELITGFSISFSERSDVIVSAFKNALENVPPPIALQPDNPASLYVAELCGKYIVENEKRKSRIKLKQKAIELQMRGSNGIFFDCGVEKIRFVTPGNSKGKKIEPAHYRIFRPFETRPKFADVYVGMDPMDAPEKLNRTDKAILADKSMFIPEYDWFVAELESYIKEYNNTKKKGGFSPQEAYDSLCDYTKMLSPLELSTFCEWKVIRKPRNGYIKLFDEVEYQHPAFGVLREGVIVGYDVKNIEEVNIYTLDGRKLESPAVKIKKGSYVDDLKSVEAIKANRRYRRETLATQGNLLLESDGINQLSSKKLVKLLNDPKTTGNNKSLIQERLNELEKYPDFNVTTPKTGTPKDESIPERKSLSRPVLPEEEEKIDYSQYTFIKKPKEPEEKEIKYSDFKLVRKKVEKKEIDPSDELLKKFEAERKLHYGLN